jgi:hypothetical protein
VSMKNGMWRKIWIRDIERILMMLKNNIPKNVAKEELSRIEPLTSRFPHSDFDLDFFARKFQIKVYEHCKTVYCTYAYHHIILSVLNKFSHKLGTHFTSSSVMVKHSLFFWRTSQRYLLFSPQSSNCRSRRLFLQKLLCHHIIRHHYCIDGMMHLCH